MKRFVPTLFIIIAALLITPVVQACSLLPVNTVTVINNQATCQLRDYNTTGYDHGDSLDHRDEIPTASLKELLANWVSKDSSIDECKTSFTMADTSWLEEKVRESLTTGASVFEHDYLINTIAIRDEVDTFLTEMNARSCTCATYEMIEEYGSWMHVRSNNRCGISPSCDSTPPDGCVAITKAADLSDVIVSRNTPSTPPTPEPTIQNIAIATIVTLLITTVYVRSKKYTHVETKRKK